MLCGPNLRRFLILLGVALASPGIASAQAAIALAGEPAPGNGGGVFSSFFQPDLNEAEQVAFRAALSGGTASQGIFIDTGSALLSIAVVGDLAPDSGGATFSSFGDPVINASGFVAFSAFLSGGTASYGLFSYFAGTITTIATSQSTAPGTSGGLYTAFSTKIAINDASEVAFVANVSGGSVTEGLFVEGAGVGRAVILIGDLAPTGVNGTYSDFSPPTINEAGNVAVTASFFIPPFDFTTAVVVEEAGGLRAAARVGDPAPGTGTGTYLFFTTSGAPGLDGDGNVYFKATVDSGSASDGLFVDSGGLDLPVAIQDDAALGAGPNAELLFFSSGGAYVNDAGDIAFASSIRRGRVNQGLFVSLSGGPAGALTLLDDPVPDVPDGSFLSLGDSPAINALGATAFRATYLDMTGGKTGIFVVPEPSGAVPLLLALATLAELRRRHVGVA